MEMVQTGTFSTLSDDELIEIDGGVIPVAVWYALATAGGFALGFWYGYCC